MTHRHAAIDVLSLLAVRATERTVWLLCVAEDASGRRGFGESTLAGCELGVGKHFARQAAAMLAVDSVPSTDTASSLAQVAAGSGITQALVDLQARREGISVAGMLGLAESRQVAVYANINRGTLTRTSGGFAERARQAVADGFRSIKIAPFDPLPPASLAGHRQSSRDIEGAWEMAIGRMRAVRAAIGPSVNLFVDCHWHLDVESAAKLVDEARGLGIGWIEAPIPETDANVPDLTRLRDRYAASGIKLAGGELLFVAEQFEEWSRKRVVDVLMPDVKYLPTLDAFLGVLAAIRRGGAEPSPHNPTGPVCHAFTSQLSVGTSFVERMEMQYRESDLFCDLVGVPRDFSEGRWNAAMAQSAPGIGFDLQMPIVERHLIGAIEIGKRTSSARGVFAQALSGGAPKIVSPSRRSADRSRSLTDS